MAEEEFLIRSLARNCVQLAEVSKHPNLIPHEVNTVAKLFFFGFVWYLGEERTRR